MAETKREGPIVGLNARWDIMPLPLKIYCVAMFAITIFLFCAHLWSWTFWGYIIDPWLYKYLLFAALVPITLLWLPLRKKDRYTIPWYDYLWAGLVLAAFVYFAVKFWVISRVGWAPPPNAFVLVLAIIVFTACVENGRRMVSPIFAGLGLVIFSYPLFAESMPGVLWGKSFAIDDLLAQFAFTTLGLMGVPARVLGEIIIAFLMFAGMMIASGAAHFFINFSLALLGKTRGGPAKVAVFASALFGSISGSPKANIASTGAITIPAMKRTGYPPHYAAAVEAVASNGGVIMPPIMGGLAFVMSIITEVPYAQIIIAAFIPAVLYFWGCFVQVDGYAGKIGLRGLSRAEMPNLWQTLRGGWPVALALAFLVFGLVYMRWGVVAPVYAAALIFILSFRSRQTMMTPRRMVYALVTIGHLFVLITCIMTSVALVIIGIQASGAMISLTVAIVGGQYSLPVVLLIVTVVCYVFGMIGVAMPIYIILAVTFIPGLVAATGLNFMAMHLFIIYLINMQSITPPVASDAFFAATVAGARPMRTAWTSMRIGVVLLFIPFFFLFSPALVLEGPILESVYLFAQALVGIWILGSGLEGYMAKVGRLSGWSRPLLV
ncbi:MAG: TRAP transporter fused permease subunit, partial [Dehalococcoidales bacterium]